MLWLSVILGVAHARDLVLPAFTPESLSDYGPAELLTELTLEALEEEGLEVLLLSDLSRGVDGEIQGCAVLSGCSVAIFEAYPEARVALIGSVGMAEGRMAGEMRFYARSEVSPVEVLTADFRAEDASMFAMEIADISADLLRYMPGSESEEAVVGASPGFVIDTADGMVIPEEFDAESYRCAPEVSVTGRIVDRTRSYVLDLSRPDPQASVVHKVDVDGFEDRCITSVEVRLTAFSACEIQLRFGTHPGQGLVLDSALFSADSYCPGWPDRLEGEYVARDSRLDELRVEPSRVPDRMAGRSCADLDMRADPIALVSGRSVLYIEDLRITGRFDSEGSTEGVCASVGTAAESRQVDIGDELNELMPESRRERARWAREHRVRTGRVEVGFLGGIGFGDVSRTYDVRVVLDEPVPGSFEAIGTHQHHDFYVDHGFVGAFYAGVAPTWWMELGLNAGVQAGQKLMSTGWEHTLDGEFVDESEEIHDPSFALLGVMEPRIRWFARPLGTVKFYATTGAAFRFYDAYGAPDLEDVSYPDIVGGVDAALMLGGGVTFDLPLGLSIALDVPWYWRFDGEPLMHEVTGQSLRDVPEEYDPARQILSFRGGVGVRL